MNDSDDKLTIKRIEEALRRMGEEHQMPSEHPKLDAAIRAAQNPSFLRRVARRIRALVGRS